MTYRISILIIALFTNRPLCCKFLHMRHVMGICMKIVNSNQRRSLQRRMFRAQLEENTFEYGELLYHADVRWLSRSIFLPRFRDFLQEVKEFLETKGEAWLMDLAFVVDITSHLNELNLQLQGKNQIRVELIGFVNTFKNKLKLISSQLMKNELKNFKNISDELFKNGGTLNKEKYYEEIIKLHYEFERRFVEFTRLEPIVTFMSYPFDNVDVEEITKI